MVSLRLPLAGMVLAGGRSHRMGRDKAMLEWHGRPLLCHILEQLAPRLSPLVVAARPEQFLPPLPVGVEVCYDPQPFQGPLLALRNALDRFITLGALFVTGCDYPFVTADVVNSLVERLADYDAVMPRVQGQAHPLLAVYRLPLISTLERVIDQGGRSLHALLDALKVRWIEDKEWQTFDPDGRVLRNLNTLEEYEQALQSP